MNKRNIQILMCTWILSASFQVVAQEQDEDVQEVRMVIERLAGLMQAGDFEAIGEVYAPGRSVHIIEGVGVNHGWEEYRDDHLRPEFEAFSNFEYSYSAIEPQIRGNIAFAAFRYDLSADMESDHIDVGGRGTIILEKMNDQWKIVHIHTSGRPK